MFIVQAINNYPSVQPPLGFFDTEQRVQLPEATQCGGLGLINLI